MTTWKTLGSTIPYKNKWLQIREDSVITPSGDEGIYGVVELANDVVYVAPVDDSGSFYLTQQFRYPVQQVTWEFTAGQTDGEDPAIAAQRELLEETGLKAGSITQIGTIAVDTGLVSTMEHLFVAEGLVKVSDDLDIVDGIISTKTFTATEVRDMIMNGAIICPHTIATFYMATEFLKSSK